MGCAQTRFRDSHDLCAIIWLRHAEMTNGLLDSVLLLACERFRLTALIISALPPVCDVRVAHYMLTWKRLREVY